MVASAGASGVMRPVASMRLVRNRVAWPPAASAACRGLGGQRTDGADWAGCREQRLPWFQGQQDLWRLSVPQTAPVLDLPEATLVEWHGAQRWVRASADRREALRALAVAAGGHATLFRGGDKGSGVFQPLAPALARIHARMKDAFDPAHIVNPGRLVPESA